MYYWTPYLEKMSHYTQIKDGYLNKCMMAQMLSNYAEKTNANTLLMKDSVYRGSAPIGIKFAFDYQQQYGGVAVTINQEEFVSPTGGEIFPGQLTTNYFTVSEQVWSNRCIGWSRDNNGIISWHKEGASVEVVIPPGGMNTINCLDATWRLTGYVWMPAISPSVFIRKWGELMTGEVEGLGKNAQELIKTTDTGEAGIDPAKLWGFKSIGATENDEWTTEWLRELLPQWMSNLGGPR